MQTLAFVAFVLGVVAYSVSGTLFYVDMARREGASNAAAWAPRVLLLGTGLHITHLALSSYVTHTGVGESLPFMLSVSALMTNVLYLLMRERAGITSMGLVVAPLALMFLLVEQVVNLNQSDSELPLALLAAHIGANLLGLSLFMLAGVASIFYLVQERRLKQKRALRGLKLPPLDKLDLMEHRLLLAGFPLQTLGVVTGAVFMSLLSDPSTGVWLRSIWAFATWLVVGGVLVMRAALGWRGRRSAYGTLAGVTCVLLVVAAYLAQAGAGS